MADTGKLTGFFAVDRRTWARVCGLGLNRAVAYLVLARGTGKSNQETAWRYKLSKHIPAFLGAEPMPPLPRS